MITYLLPTHNRPQRLAQTLDALAALDRDAPEACGDGEVIVIDNASDPAVKSDSRTLQNGLPLRIIRSEENLGAAARNLGVKEAHGDWIVMLDDDSFPLDTGHLDVLNDAPPDVAAIGADIVIADGSRESGGLPEVFIGCGVAIRRKAFLEVGGYDPTFDYYAEEYDFCAKLLLNRWRVVHDHRFRVQHDKIAQGRDFNRIIHRLVRNNGWVTQRYAPENRLQAEMHDMIARYAGIAIKEHAAEGFACGMTELLQTVHTQPRNPMPEPLHQRFSGLSHARQSLGESLREIKTDTIAVVDEGKNAWVIHQVLCELGLSVVQNENEADALVIGTMSPGPMIDAWRRRVAIENRPVICPWHPLHAADPQRSIAWTATTP